MNVGLPGTGLGGLFYLLAALAMPPVSVFRILRGRGVPARWALVWRQFALAVTILLAFTAEYWILERIVMAVNKIFSSLNISSSLTWHSEQIARIVEAPPLIFAVVTVVLLAVLIVTVEISGLQMTRGRSVGQTGPHETERARW